MPEPYPVPVKCEVPYTPCVIKGNEVEIALQLRECIITIRKDAEICR